MRRQVYIAAPFSQRPAARAARTILERHGWECTSRWIDNHLEEWDLLTPEQKAKEGQEDLHDVYRADLLVLLNNVGPSTAGGMHTELGYAIGLRKPIVIVGGGTNVFHYFDTMRHVDRVEDVK